MSEFADRDAFIRAMRGVAASVTVVTTKGAAGKFGATVSSFCSVSADPPMVLVCLNAASRIAKEVEKNGRFCVNILPHGATALADRFAGRDDDVLTNRFTDVQLQDEDGVGLAGATVLRCSIDSVQRAATHLVCIGNVDEVVGASEDPLTWYDGAYHRVIPLRRAS
ncbi:MAG: flavin reductase family protein [Pseudomonadota bacterium]